MKVVLQDGMKDCGICSLLSIIRYYGGNVSKEYLRELTNTSKSGVSAYMLVSTARKLGFYAEALNGELEKIDVNSLPCIAHVILHKGYQHFVVLDKVDFEIGKVQLMDPARGKRILSISEFKLMASNNYIFLTPVKKLPCVREEKIIFTTILRFIRKKRKSFVILFLLTVSYFLFNLLSAFHFKYLLDHSLTYSISKNLGQISFFVLFLYFCKEVSSFLRNLYLFKFSNLLDEEITLKTYQQIILLPYLYYKNRTSGEVISRLKDLSTIRNFLSQFFCFLTTDLMSVSIFIVFLFQIDSKLSFLTLAYSLIYFLFSIFYSKRKKRNLERYYHEEEKVQSYLVESLSSVEVVKGMHIEKRILDRFRLKYQTFLERVYRFMRVQESEVFLQKSIQDLFYLVLYYLGVSYIIQEAITLSEFIVFQSVLGFYFTSYQSILSFFQSYPNFKISLERIEELYSIRKEEFRGSSYYKTNHLEGEICYQNLDFSYQSKKLLSSISLTIHPGDHIFLSGPSGSGKSTLMKLLMRYLEVPYGKIKIQGIDINHYHLDILRRNIIYVSQHEFLFQDSFYHNITLYQDISEDLFQKVSSFCFLDDIIKSHCLSYDGLVEENGFNLSGGERQRIILARSLLKNGEIYIFDEALSQIDVVRERKILKNIFSYLEGKTIIVISHRFDNKDLFSRSLSIIDGKLYEEDL